MTAAAAAPPPRRALAAPRSLAAGHGRERGRGVRLAGGVRRSPAVAGGEASLGTPGSPGSPRCLPGAGVPRPAAAPAHRSAQRAPAGLPRVRSSSRDAAPNPNSLSAAADCYFWKVSWQLVEICLCSIATAPSSQSKLKAGLVALLSLRLIISCRLVNDFCSACSETL